jgi:DtxR family Mn-dependent transcriptional regulator
LKQIFMLQQRSAQHLVSMGKLAESVGVAPGTATAMVKALADSSLLSYEPRGGVRLSTSGEQLALHVLRRHRLIELFLVEVLGLDWSEVHEEAEELEHAISDKVLEKMDHLLGHPTMDPHGDPIPTAMGQLKRMQLHSLAECRPGQTVSIRRVSDQDPAFLQFVHRNGLTPGMELQVIGSDTAADAVTVRPEGRSDVTVGRTAAAKVLVEETRSKEPQMHTDAHG